MHAYLSAGWPGAIPVGNAPAQKDPPPAGFTGWAGVDPSGADIQAWTEGPEAYRNIALHLQPGVYGLDIDGYKGKSGPDTLARLQQEHGLPPLPATWSSTARGPGQPSRIHLFRATLPPGRIWVDQPGGRGAGIEAIHVGHRYLVCAPSIHPDTGTPYVWYAAGDPRPLITCPRPDALPELPPAWVMALSKPGDVIPGVAADHEATLRTVHAFRERGDGRPCTFVEHAIGTSIAALRATLNGAALHPTANADIWRLVRLGFEGHRGARNALAQHHSAFIAARQATGRGAGERHAEAEWWRMVRGAVGKAAGMGPPAPICQCEPEVYGMAVPAGFPTEPPRSIGSTVAESAGAVRADTVTAVAPPQISLTLPREFWDARPRLALIRRAAHSRRRSPDVALYGVLARISAMAPHDMTAKTHAGNASLNIFAAIVGASGRGKSTGLSIAAELMPHDPEVPFAEYPLGSGEGMAEAYIGEVTDLDPETGKPKRHRRQVRHNALFSVDEGAALNKMLERAGATVGETLRSAWVGAMIGQKNGRAETTRLIPAGSYSMGVLLGYQETTAGPLLADVDAGTPQRFAWVWADGGDRPRTRAEMPAWDPSSERLPNPFVRAAEQEHEIAAGMFGTVAPPGINRDPVTFAPEILDELFDHEVMRDDGLIDTDPYHSHRPLMMVKLAVGLCLLDCRRHVTAEDWTLARVMWLTSDAVLHRVLAVGKAEAQRSAEVRREQEAQTALHVEQRTASAAVVRVARRISLKVHVSGAMTHKDIYRLTAGRDKQWVPEALEYAEGMQWIHHDESGKVVPGMSLPSAL